MGDLYFAGMSGRPQWVVAMLSGSLLKVVYKCDLVRER